MINQANLSAGVEPGSGKRLRIAYWIITGLFALAMTASGLFDLSQNPQFMAALERMGYPPYLAIVIGVAKLLGVAAILFSPWRFLKEWAYAGFVIDLVGALVSHAMIGDPPNEAMAPVLPLVLTAASYFLWRRYTRVGERA